ncbi:MAG TPA: potassium-transporting ATPase subunit KdpC [Caulobacteraceae bacterium]|jgi:K+-transporting ATPase ATPase C chain|nr:potassium-transporting ATPase subunit KdpC [Caulobacteraceae bacterium]
MLSQLRASLVSIVFFVVLTGLLYPLAITGIGQIVFPHQANGSLVRTGGKIVGSQLIAQAFTGPGYLHPRGSSAGNGYDATNSSASNLGPMDPKLRDRIAKDASALRVENPNATIPADAVTQSGSGLDPDISPENAAFQAPRIAKARNLPLTAVQALIDRNTHGSTLGFIGQAHVNVLAVNLALDGH